MALKSVAFRLDEELMTKLDEKSKQLGCSKKFLVEKGLKIVLGLDKPSSLQTKVCETQNNSTNQNTNLINKFRQKAGIE
jgi:hypothetical protein